MVKKYDLHCGDMFGEDDRATEILNNKFIPLIKRRGIRTEHDVNEVIEILRRIVEEACSNERLVTSWEYNAGEGV